MQSNILKIILITSFICFCTGCSKQEAKNDSILSETNVLSTTTAFPLHLQSKVSEILSIDADCIYPDKCSSGKGEYAKLSGNMFWDNQETIINTIFHNAELSEDTITDYDTIQERTCISSDNSSLLSINTNNYLNFSTANSLYVSNLLFTDTRYDAYNGDKFQEITDLPFLSQHDAWVNVTSFLNSIGVATSEQYICYVMDHKTMQLEEEALIQKSAVSGDPVPNSKTEWDASDDCYYFSTYASWNEYPILPALSGEGLDENNISVIYSANGIESLLINGYCPLELDKEFTVQSPEKLPDKINEYLNNIITGDFYTLQQIRLCQKVMQLDALKHSATILPVWECTLLVSPSYDPEDIYIQKIYFNAETLEVVL